MYCEASEAPRGAAPRSVDPCVDLCGVIFHLPAVFPWWGLIVWSWQMGFTGDLRVRGREGPSQRAAEKHGCDS